jgi:hypothetical protein
MSHGEHLTVRIDEREIEPPPVRQLEMHGQIGLKRNRCGQRRDTEAALDPVQARHRQAAGRHRLETAELIRHGGNRLAANG